MPAEPGDYLDFHDTSEKNDEEAKAEAIPTAVAVTQPQTVGGGASYDPTNDTAKRKNFSSSSLSITFINLKSYIKSKSFVKRRYFSFVVCGKVNIDLSQAKFVHPNTSIYTFTVCGSTNVILPPGVNARSAGCGIIGGFSSSGEEFEHAPTVAMKGMTILGGAKMRCNKEAPMLVRV